jgi:plastocyanin domain-containing protein
VTSAVSGRRISNVATIQDGVQLLNTSMASGYEPVVVQAGIPVRWTIRATEDSLNGCNNPLTIPSYGIQLRMVPGDNVIEFTPKIVGDVLYTCWMGMISSTIRVVQDVASVKASDIPAPGAPPGSAGGGMSCCAGAPAPSAGSSSGASAFALAGPVSIPVDRLVLGTIADGTQRVATDVTEGGYSPGVLVVQRGIPTVWTFRAKKLTDANYRIEFPSYGARMELDATGGEVRLVPQSDFVMRSWKGDFATYVKVVDDLKSVDRNAVREEVRAYSASGRLPASPN